MSGVIIVVIAFGLPVVFAIVLIRAANNYQATHGKPNNFLVRRVAKEMDVEKATAAVKRPGHLTLFGQQFRAFTHTKFADRFAVGDPGRDDWPRLLILDGCV